MVTPLSPVKRPHRSAHRRRRWLWTAAALLVALGIVIGVAIAVLSPDPGVPSSAPTPSATASASPTPTPTPLTAAETLLSTTADPAACAVIFDIEGDALDPQLQTQQALYSGLPIPTRDGAVFAGWYATAADAAALATPNRVNGADLVACTERQVTLHGAWMTPEQNADAGTRVPILMYHQFTTKPEGESGWLRGNFAFIDDFRAHMSYIAEQGFYLPTWDELNAFIDGTLHLPPRSVIITDDDADQTWLELAVPIIDEKQLLTTSFVITAFRHEPTPSTFVLQRSHTDQMHTAGDNGKGRMVNWSADQIAADLEASAAVLGAKEVVAYPYGHHNDTTRQGVTQAGFTFGRTIDWGYVTPGTDKLALPVIRINYGDSVESLARSIG